MHERCIPSVSVFNADAILVMFISYIHTNADHTHFVPSSLFDRWYIRDGIVMLAFIGVRRKMIGESHGVEMLRCK